MLLNGRDLTNDGLTLIGLSGWLNGPSLRRQSTELPQAAGVIPSLIATSEDRELTVRLRASLTSLADRAPKLAVIRERFAGLLTLRFSDWPDRVIRAVAWPMEVTPAIEDAAYAVATLEVSIPLICHDAASYDAEPQVLVIGTSPTQVALGTLPSTGILIWQGAWTQYASRTLTYRDAAGTARTTMSWAAGSTLASDDVLEVDLARQYVTTVTAPLGTRANAYSWRTSGSWIALDPAHGAPSAGRWPTLEVSAGSAVLLYRRAYSL